MTTYTDEVSIYNAEAIQDGIDGAAETATNYITTVTNDGIMVADAGSGASSGSITSSTTGWHLGGVLEYIRSGISRFWIGLKNQNDSSPTVRIGKKYTSGATDNESHMELDYHSMQLIDKEGNTYFYVSDLRDADGEAIIVDTWAADGVTTTYSLSAQAEDTSYSVTVDGVEQATGQGGSIAAKTQYVVRFNTAPSYGSVIVITYTTTSENVKAYTFGKRNAQYPIGGYSVAEGLNVYASGLASHAEGYHSQARGAHAHAEGEASSYGLDSHAEGQSVASGNYSHAEGASAWATGEASHAEGSGHAEGTRSHAEGSGCYATGSSSHAEGNSTTASQTGSHAEGFNTRATGFYSHAEGGSSLASGMYSHAEGTSCIAGGASSHAQNLGSKASSDNQTALGTYNIEDTNDDYAVIVGNGTANNARSNAVAIDWNGRAELWHPEIVRGTAPSSSIYSGGGALKLVDKNGVQIGFVQPVQYTNGTEGIQLGVGNSDASDYNTLQLAYDANDNATVSVANQTTWRNALGASSGIWPASVGGTGTTNYLSGGVMDKINVSTALSTSGSTWKSGGDFSLTAGIYIAIIHTEWASNTSGSRMHCLTTSNPGSSGFTTPTNSTSTQMQTANGTVRMTSMAFLSPSSSTTYYLGLYQNSGGSLNCTARRVRVIQLA